MTAYCEGDVTVVTLLYNGVIHTLNPQQPQAQALAIRDGYVLAVGSEGKVRAAAAGERVEGINLQGRAVIPGLTDAHVHITWYGISMQRVRLSNAGSLEEALAWVEAKAKSLPSGAWVQGGGWNHTLWGEQWPTRTDLDQVCPDRPVALIRKDGHSTWINSQAMALAGIDSTTPDPPDGEIQRDQDGEPTGILLEAAQGLVQRIIPPPPQAERLKALQLALAEALRYGITSLHIPPSPRPDDAPEALADLHILYARGALPVRCLVHLAARDLDAATALGLRSGLGDRWLRIGGLKIFADGTLGSETAETLSHYEGRRHLGMAAMPAEDLEALIAKSIQNGMSVVVHAIGDAANRKVLNAIHTASEAPHLQLGNVYSPHTLALPNRIEHAQLVHPKDIPRFAELRVIASMQPVHVTSDMEIAERLWGQRCATAYACRSLLESGATLAFGSDAPVEAFNPWKGMHAAVTRQRTDNTPSGGWYPEQCLSLAQSLEAYCVGPAVASAEAAVKGRLSPGMLADIAVLNVDPFGISPMHLHRVEVDMTFVEGEVRWEK